MNGDHLRPSPPKVTVKEGKLQTAGPAKHINSNVLET